METNDINALRAEYNYDHLKSNTQRAFWTLLDGEQHGLQDLRETCGDAVDTRIRELRKPVFGEQRVEMEIDPETKMARYRLSLDSVEEDWARRILGTGIER